MNEPWLDIQDRLIAKGVTPEERMRLYAVFHDCDQEVKEMLWKMTNEYVSAEMEIIRIASSKDFSKSSNKIQKLKKLLDRVEKNTFYIDKFNMLNRLGMY